MILQNDGRMFAPYYPKSVAILFGESSILKLNGNLHRRVHGLIGSFFKSHQTKARITKDIEECVLLSIDNWNDGQLVYIQDETKNVGLFYFSFFRTKPESSQFQPKSLVYLRRPELAWAKSRDMSESQKAG